VELDYSYHARQRMAPPGPANPDGRNISEAEVQATVEQPDIYYTDPKGKPTYIRHMNGRRIKVVLARDRPGYVVTAAVDPG
jgi:hypothetical protein